MPRFWKGIDEKSKYYFAIIGFNSCKSFFLYLYFTEKNTGIESDITPVNEGSVANNNVDNSDSITLGLQYQYWEEGYEKEFFEHNTSIEFNLDRYAEKYWFLSEEDQQRMLSFNRENAIRNYQTVSDNPCHYIRHNLYPDEGLFYKKQHNYHYSGLAQCLRLSLKNKTKKTFEGAYELIMDTLYTGNLSHEMMEKIDMLFYAQAANNIFINIDPFYKSIYSSEALKNVASDTKRDVYRSLKAFNEKIKDVEPADIFEEYQKNKEYLLNLLGEEVFSKYVLEIKQ